MKRMVNVPVLFTFLTSPKTFNHSEVHPKEVSEVIVIALYIYTLVIYIFIILYIFFIM